MLYTYTKLTDEQLRRIQAFESQTQKKLLALTPVNLRPEDLTPEELQQLQDLEQELGLVLLVVK